MSVTAIERNKLMNDIAGLAEAAKALSQPICKLVEGVIAGCGKAYEPIHVKRMAQARARELNVIAAAMRDNMDVPILYQEGIVRVDSQDVQNLAQRAAVRVGHQEMTKQLNIEHIVDQAAFNLEDTEAVPETPVDKDWMMRFFDCAGGINDDDVQKLWAKVLAGEIKQPGSFSLRTVDVLRNLSRREALLFQKANELAIYSSRGAILYTGGNVMQLNGIDVYDIATLADAGLLSAEGLIQTVTVDDNAPIALYNEKYICQIKQNGHQQNLHVKYPFCAFSQAGEELRSILSVEPQLHFFIQIVNDVRKKYPQFSYSVNEVICRYGNQWDFKVANMLPPV